MLTKVYEIIQFILNNTSYNTDNSFKTIIKKFITNNAFKSYLNPTTSIITYQNANLSADNQQLQQS